MNKIAMKKIFFSIMFAGLLITTSLATNIAFSEKNFEAPDGDKKVKKETPKAEKKAVKVKEASIDQGSIEPIEIKEENKSEEYTDPNNPLNNFDCTKKGFDRE